MEKGCGDQGLRLFCSQRLLAALYSFSVPGVDCALPGTGQEVGFVGHSFLHERTDFPGMGVGMSVEGTARLPGFGTWGLAGCWLPRFHPFLPAWKDGVMVWRGEGGRGEAGQLGSALGRGGCAPTPQHSRWHMLDRPHRAQVSGREGVPSLSSSTQRRPRRWEAGHVEMSSWGQREDGSDLGPDLNS